MPAIRAARIWEETGEADARGISYIDWYRIPTHERAVMLARSRLKARLEYWLHEWRMGRNLPDVTVTPA